jgi:hypothetical protein
MLVCAFLCASCTRDRGCSAHPAFPAPSHREGQRPNLGQTVPRECETASLSTSLRGALATKQSIPPFARLDGLLRGACHPAALCADRVARNDPEGARHVLCVIARECEASSTPRPLDSSTDVSGILDRPVKPGNDQRRMALNENRIATTHSVSSRPRAGTHIHKCPCYATLRPQSRSRSTSVAMGPSVRREDEAKRYASFGGYDVAHASCERCRLTPPARPSLRERARLALPAG